MRISWVSSSALHRITSVAGVTAVLCAASSLPAVASGTAVASSTPVASARSTAIYSAAVDMPPRFQWNENFGYCGEVALISAGLFYGQYLSQYDARATASSKPQYRSSSQLLLGVNDTHAAAGMHLAYS